MRRFNYVREQAEFISANLARLPSGWGGMVRDESEAVLASAGIRASNEYLRGVVEPLPVLVDISRDDAEIQTLSENMAFKVREFFSMCGALGAGDWFLAHKNALKKCEDLCGKYAVRYPHEHDMGQQRARLCDDTWWLRGLRNSHARAREAAARDAGIVHKKQDIYVSEDTLERRTQQRRRNAKLLDGIEMVNENGEVMKLSAIAAAGQSNQDNRRAELMTRITGFEALANKYSHKALFVTLTCPSRMHANLTNGKVNPKYDGTKPSDAQKYLVHCWAKSRALLAKDGVRFYGLRVAEPHHDGTPHWHLILFYDGKQSSLKKIKWFITQKFIEVDRDELARDISPRVKYVEINPSKGVAAGYVIKYVAKNLGGIDGEKSDEADVASETLAARVEAWASTWRIRQFQQVGGHFVSVWRELRRVDECQLEGKRPQFVKAWQVCQKKGDKKANFAEYVESMGGLERRARESNYTVDYEAITKQGKYGESVVLKPLGVGERFGREVVRNNRKEWVQL